MKDDFEVQKQEVTTTLAVSLQNRGCSSGKIQTRQCRQRRDGSDGQLSRHDAAKSDGLLHPQRGQIRFQYVDIIRRYSIDHDAAVNDPYQRISGTKPCRLAGRQRDRIFVVQSGQFRADLG
jgi:hypothetical protein